MAFVTPALVLVPSLIAGEESALAGGEREWQAAKGAAQGTNSAQTAAGELARMASELRRLVAQCKCDDSTRGSGGLRISLRRPNRLTMCIWRVEPRSSLARRLPSGKQKRAVAQAEKSSGNSG